MASMPPPSKPPYKSGYSHLGLYLCRLLPFCTPWSESAGQSEVISADMIYILALHNGMDVRGLPVVLSAGYSEDK